MSSTLSKNRSDVGMGSTNITETDLVSPTLEILTNAPYLQVLFKAQDHNIPPGRTIITSPSTIPLTNNIRISDSLLQSVQYLVLQGQYHLIMPPNGMQDSFLGHVWFVQMGPTVELLPNAP